MLREKITGRRKDVAFPPKPLSRKHARRIIINHCRKMQPSAFVEAGCAVCGCLVPRKQLTPLSKFE
ncbi:hypothetical protein B0H11DRAFT_1715983, partial [Mycena galericulata]